MKYKIVMLCLLIFFSAVAFTQNFFNKGTDFWITYPAYIDGLGSIRRIYVTSNVNASGAVVVNGQSIAFSVTANLSTPSMYLNCDTAARPQASPPEDIQYKLTLTRIGNCTVYDSVAIRVMKAPMILMLFHLMGMVLMMTGLLNI